MKLIGLPTSPYVRKTRIVLAEKKLDYQLEIENVWEPDTKIQSFNPLGKVPCLLVEDNEALYDSRVIVEYLDTLSPVTRLIPQSGRERTDVKCWEALADGLLDAGVTIVKEKQRSAEQMNQAWIDRQVSKIHAALAAMSKGLGTQPFCAGPSYSLADVAVGCALGYLDFRFADIDWRTPYPNLGQLYGKVSARPSFVDTQPPPA